MCAHVNVSKCLHVHMHERVHIPGPLQAGMCHLFVLSVLMWAWPARRGAVTDQQTNPCYPTHFHLLSHPVSSPSFPSRLPAFSTGIKYPLLSRRHLWHMEFLFNFRSEPVCHWCSGYDASQPEDAQWRGSTVIAVYNRHLTGVILMTESHSVTAALCNFNLWHNLSTYVQYMVGIDSVWVHMVVTCR